MLKSKENYHFLEWNIISFVLNCWSKFSYNSNFIFFLSDGYFWKTSSSELVNNSSVLSWAVSRPFVLLQEWILKAAKSHFPHIFSHPASPRTPPEHSYFPRPHLALHLCHWISLAKFHFIPCRTIWVSASGKYQKFRKLELFSNNLFKRFGMMIFKNLLLNNYKAMN